jgi:hypothetical protein
MDKQRAETDKICMNAASIFRAMDALKQQQRELDAKLVEQISAYRDTVKVYAWSRDHMRQACQARGLLL